MSQPERITEQMAEAMERRAVQDWTRLLGLGVQDPDPAEQLARFATVIAEVRRLRGLIDAGVTDPTVQHWLAPLAGQGWIPGSAVRDLVAEAEAIRAERR